MASFRHFRRISNNFIMVVLALWFTGCAIVDQHPSAGRRPIGSHSTRTPKRAHSTEPPQSSPIAQISFQTDVLSFADLLNLASQENPDLRSARAKLEAARGQFVQAGLYPNPRVNPQLNDLWDNRNNWGQTGVAFEQLFLTGGKRRLDKSAAQFGVQFADWDAVTTWFSVAIRIRQAYYALVTAQRVERATKDIVGLAQDALDAAVSLRKAGAGNKVDEKRATVERDRVNLQLTAAQQRTVAARRMLALSVGVQSLNGYNVAETTEFNPQKLNWDDVVAQVLANTSPIQASIAKIQQAEQLLERAKVQPIPDVQVRVRPYYSVAEQDTRVNVRAGVALPIFDRNQGNIQSAQANLAQAHAELEKTKLLLTEQLTIAFERYQVARRLIASYKTHILPDAQASLELIQFGYKNGDPKYDYTALLQAQQILFQSRLGYEQSRGEYLQALSEIEGILQTSWRD